ncbi:M14 family metallopeptidase [Rhodocaloribacter litoris]|uniref:M14 family metallopeptidase n=1 Tax=Rhodocaloribacter litoris TaxID=2558931 RepID=UPI00142051FA|nr:M14 family metallopeptidase [Rhodocaloribacter litoris]QXD15983.1 M14 family metallopeptidase [Rhodocaloribacter litoris]
MRRERWYGAGWWLIGWLAVAGARAQPVDLSFLQTRAEATGYEETTRYDELMGFLDVLDRASPRLHLTRFGYTTEGRALPLMVYGAPEGAGPGAVRRTGKTRVFVMANIHAGEVCGKEAMLMLLRSLAAGRYARWADSLVVMVAPIYNADGNERVNLFNRPRQHGPVGGMGQRPNAQGLDLNRDHVKLDSPEARSLVRLLNDYDPHVVVDLHTTNGTVHAYHLTYAPPLHPNTDAGIVALLRNVWLPEVTDIVREKYGWDFYYYGNLPSPGSERARGWYTFDHRPRFSTNYAGLRNRFAILSEAYAYATFEERVQATLRFVEEVLHFAYANATVIRKRTAAADAGVVVGRPLALTARPAPSAEPVEILLGAVAEEQNPYSGAVMLRRRDVRRPERMTEYGTFVPVETVPAPAAYVVPASLAAVRDRLQAHGIRFTVLGTERPATVERFRIDSVHVAERPYQNRHLRTLYGGYEPAETTLPAGALVVPVDQPLGRLAFTLLEPRSDDGLATWGLLDEALEGATYYPILRLPAGE